MERKEEYGVKKKLIAGICLSMAVVLAAGGGILIRNEKETEAYNKQITQELDRIGNITVSEGESLPNMDNLFADAELVNMESLQADIQNVDVTVPGEYEVLYTFLDTKGNERQKSVTCTVTADLESHVYGMDDIVVDYGEDLPPLDVTYDEWVDSVVRDDTQVNTESPGTYPIVYSILGTDGELEEVEYHATVLDTRPEPTATPIPTPSPDQEQGTDLGGQGQAEQAPQTGNIEQPIQQVVKTGDTTSVLPVVALFTISAAGIALSIFLLRKKQNS